jgi:hypothetical protein
MLAFFTPILQKFGIYIIVAVIIAAVGGYFWYDISSKNKSIAILQANVATLQANYNNALATNKSNLAEITKLQESSAFIQKQLDATNAKDMAAENALIKDIQIIESIKAQQALINQRNSTDPKKIVIFNGTLNNTINCGFAAITGGSKSCP